jgi:hypothetical protein
VLSARTEELGGREAAARAELGARTEELGGREAAARTAARTVAAEHCHCRRTAGAAARTEELGGREARAGTRTVALLRRVLLGRTEPPHLTVAR